ncbi:ribonuclease P protein subunit p20 [Frankliniella occidentalis]|uniref:Ribonuclease P protein subunit p20 n=1 Tax=Frankliniella occidentalis TaxID=133901 RepID=A0A6J1S408_FRAOC|nr:ribonuclease P protein subunit p20 [Frankliniella occidentalis]
MAEADNSRSDRNQENKHWNRNKKVTDKDHVVRKRQPPRLPKRPNDIYVTNRSNFQSELDKCLKLLESGEKEVFVHGLGAAVNRAVNLALQLESKFLGTVQLTVNTSTTTLIDDLEPLHDQATYETQTRQNSVVHIRIQRTALAGAQN